MSNIGHNETAVRLAGLVGDAQIALDRVARGEADATEGWLAYGGALNEGRSLHKGDAEFGQWLIANSLSQVGQAEVHPKDREAAMWATANANQLAEAKAASKARTMRGWHDQWKKIQAEREAVARKAQEKADREAAKAKADADRKEADERAEAEAKAVAEAKAATNEADRKAAEDRAEQERMAKEAAQAAAVAADEAAADEPEPEQEDIPADVATVMHKHAALTREALLRIHAEFVIKTKPELAKAATEIQRLKDRLANHSGDKDETIRRLQKVIDHKGSEVFRANQAFEAEKKKNYRLTKRVEELEKMEVQL